ncbi:MAG: RIP metalloprotease RseP [Candidatus Latescibacteria bacterium]|nr:RIP metalloprotease RseP [Candidatus Latescibacterota bacterium]
MLITLLSWLFVIGVLIFIHELGHFFVAKWVGIRVERFSLGFPPRLIGKRVGETDYCISAIPFGGYVKLSGIADVGAVESHGAPWEFGAKSILERVGVILAGPLMNFLFAFIVIFSLVYFVGSPVHRTTKVGVVDPGSSSEQAGLQAGDQVKTIAGRPVAHWNEIIEGLGTVEGGTTIEVVRDGHVLSLTFEHRVGEEVGIDPFLPPRVGSVQKGAPADRAGLTSGDLMTAINGEPVHQWYEMQEKIRALPKQEIFIEWERGEKRMSARVTTDAMIDREHPEVRYGQIGITLGADYTYLPVGTLEALKVGMGSTVRIVTDLVHLLVQMVTGNLSRDTLGGVITIAKFAGDAARVGIGELFGFMAFLSINLGFFNLLPIPVLDGGHLLFLGIEAVIRRPLPLRQREIVQQIGAILLIFLVIYVTFNDIHRFFFTK